MVFRFEGLQCNFYAPTDRDSNSPFEDASFVVFAIPWGMLESGFDLGRNCPEGPATISGRNCQIDSKNLPQGFLEFKESPWSDTQAVGFRM